MDFFSYLLAMKMQQFSASLDLAPTLALYLTVSLLKEFQTSSISFLEPGYFQTGTL